MGYTSITPARGNRIGILWFAVWDRAGAGILLARTNIGGPDDNVEGAIAGSRAHVCV
jgi:hypothetical protein